MSAVDYADIANLSWDNIQEPKPVPNGTYLLRLSNATFQPSKEEGKSPRVMFVYSVREAMDDVDSDKLADLGEGYDITENKVFETMFIEDGASWKKVQRHLEKHSGFKSSGKVLEDLKKAKGGEVLASLITETFIRQDKTPGEKNSASAFAAVEG